MRPDVTGASSYLKQMGAYFNISILQTNTRSEQGVIWDSEAYISQPDRHTNSVRKLKQTKKRPTCGETHTTRGDTPPHGRHTRTHHKGRPHHHRGRPTPHGEDTPPHGGDTPPHGEDTPPHGGDTPPHGEDTPPQGRRHYRRHATTGETPHGRHTTTGETPHGRRLLRGRAVSLKRPGLRRMSACQLLMMKDGGAAPATSPVVGNRGRPCHPRPETTPVDKYTRRTAR